MGRIAQVGFSQNVTEFSRISGELKQCVPFSLLSCSSSCCLLSSFGLAHVAPLSHIYLHAKLHL